MGLMSDIFLALEKRMYLLSIGQGRSIGCLPNNLKVSGLTQVKLAMLEAVVTQQEP